MKIVIIEDEPRARDLLQTIIQRKCTGVEEIHDADNLADGVALIKKVNPELVFLDIELPNEPGTRILNHFTDQEVNFEIVFTTAYSEYALQAFEMNAIDYLLKPLRPEKVKMVIEKVKADNKHRRTKEKLKEFTTSLENRTFKKIGLPNSEGIMFVPVEEIINVEADGMYARVYTSDGSMHIVTKPLKFFNRLLEMFDYFYKPHRSHIINFNYVQQYSKKDGNSIILENGRDIPIVKERKDEFLEKVYYL